ncbi:MAG: hypothetical protein C4334_06520 [Pyrinomonas sp.]|uniref:hypothetical protein n=1 Tax=Pyrinomonas sp. TaxID=2080306 RepID=UPI00332FD68A
MKVTPTFNRPNPIPDAKRTKTRQASEKEPLDQRTAPETFDETGQTEARSLFADVFEEVTRSAQRRERSEADQSEDRCDDKERTGQAEREPEAHRREEKRSRSDAESGFGGWSGSFNADTETNATEAPNARAILHIADLERIVSAIRLQVLGNRREVIIQLQRSVLEGLRVKLSADEMGRIMAEFIAASERARAQIEARANELMAIMRSRGINLASLRTSVGAETANEGFDRNGRGENVAHKLEASKETCPAPSEPTEVAPGESETSYRA